MSRRGKCRDRFVNLTEKELDNLDYSTWAIIKEIAYPYIIWKNRKTYKNFKLILDECFSGGNYLLRTTLALKNIFTGRYEMFRRYYLYVVRKENIYGND